MAKAAMSTMCGNCGKKKTGAFRMVRLTFSGGRWVDSCPACAGEMAGESTAVSHPIHYGGDTPHETIKCLEAWGLEGDALLWNAVKYISRAGKKGEKLEDLKKAKSYLDRRIAAMEAAK